MSLFQTPTNRNVIYARLLHQCAYKSTSVKALFFSQYNNMNYLIGMGEDSTCFQKWTTIML